MLSSLLAYADEDPQTAALIREGGEAFVSQSLRPYLIAALLDRDPDRPAIVVAGDDRAARDLAAGLKAWLAPRSVRYYPSRGVAYESHLAPPPHLVGLRIAALDALLEPTDAAAPVVVVSAVALSEKVPDRSMRPHGFELRAGDLIDLDEVALDLVAAGYERVDQVEDRGQFAIRGGLLDLFPATEDRAVRVDLFGDEIESLRWFSTFTQRSLGDADVVEVAPAAELAPEHRELAEIAALEDPADRPEITELLPVDSFYPLLELVGSQASVMIAGSEDLAPALADHWQDVTAAFHDADANHLYVDPDEIIAALDERVQIRLSSIDQDQRFAFRGQAANIAARGLKEAEPELEKLARSNYRTVLAFAGRGEGERFAYNLGRLKVHWLDEGTRGHDRPRPADARQRPPAGRVHRAPVPPRRHPRPPAVPAPQGRRSRPPVPAAAACCAASPICAPATSSSTRTTGSPALPALTPRRSPTSPATTSTWSTPALTACSCPSTSWPRSAVTSAAAARIRRSPSSGAPAGTRSRPAPAAPPRSWPASCSTSTPSASAARATPSRSTPTGSENSKTRFRTPKRPTSATRSSSSRPTWSPPGRWIASSAATSATARPRSPCGRRSRRRRTASR